MTRRVRIVLAIAIALFLGGDVARGSVPTPNIDSIDW